MFILELHVIKQRDAARLRKITHLREMRVRERERMGGKKTSFPLCQCTQAKFL